MLLFGLLVLLFSFAQVKLDLQSRGALLLRRAAAKDLAMQLVLMVVDLPHFVQPLRIALPLPLLLLHGFLLPSLGLLLLPQALEILHLDEKCLERRLV